MVAGIDGTELTRLVENLDGKRDKLDERDRRRQEAAAARAAKAPPATPARTRPERRIELAPRPSARPAVGCGMRPGLLGALFSHLGRVEIWEHNADWYFGEDAGRTGARTLARYAETAPVALHSLGLSVGSHDCLADDDRIEALTRLAEAADVPHVSDHLAFTRAGGRTLEHFVPLWRVPEQLELVVRNVDELQDRLGRRLALENPATILDPGGDISTATFVSEVARRTGCGILLDLENLRVDHDNGRIDERVALAELDLDAVLAVHLAGGTTATDDEPAWDTHCWPVAADRFALLAELLGDLTSCEHIVIERDDRFDHAEEVVADLEALHSVVAPVRAIPAATAC
jgi:uncharacterized protein (UPF0276 family)